MMKKLLLAISAIAIFTTANAQLSITLTTPTAGSTVVASDFAAAVTITNTGTAAIPAGDTIFYWLTVNSSTTPLSFGGTPGSWSIDILTAPLAAGASVTKSSVTYIFTTAPSTQRTDTICAKTAIGLVAAANPSSAASSCYYVNRSLVSINENALEESTKVFVANGILNMSSTFQEVLNFTVVSITGQIVSQGTFNSNKQVDLSNVAKGIYAVMVTNGTEKVTKKVAVQ
jgi:hypothetical protein